MRGHDEQTTHMFSYLSPEQRVPADHPLRAVRALTDEALQTMSRRFASLYATTGRPSIPPEQLLRALLLQVLYTVRSERLLMEELNYNLLFRWFVGLNMDDPSLKSFRCVDAAESDPPEDPGQSHGQLPRGAAAQ